MPARPVMSSNVHPPRFQYSRFQKRGLRLSGGLAAVVAASTAAPFAKNRSSKPSPSASKAATPPPIVSGRSLRLVFDAACRKVTPDDAVTSAKVIVVATRAAAAPPANATKHTRID